MDLEIFLLLGQDGLVNGSIYALLAIALVLVFSVTRIIFIPQGEFVAFGALTLASLQAGGRPGTLWLLVALSILAGFIEAYKIVRGELGERATALGSALFVYGVLPLLLTGLVLFASPVSWPAFFQILLALGIVVPLGPLIYRIGYQPLQSASILVLLIVSVAIHLTLVGLGLLFFGAEGSRSPAFIDGGVELAGYNISSQSILVIAVAASLIVGLYLFFERTLWGKALRATAINRIGARLMGISPTQAGRLSFLVAATIGALSGILISPITTIYYDTGFIIGLKGFVAAIIGGLSSFPVAAAGALLVGLLESFSSFWASAFKEVIVFTLIIPVLLWRSLTSHTVEEEE